MSKPIRAVAFFLFAATGIAALARDVQPGDPALASQITRMADEDQRVRKERFPLHANEPVYIRAMAEVDERNQREVRQIFSERGWLGTALVGQQAADAFWLLVQHFPALLEQALPLMQSAAERGELSKSMLAKSIDRVMTISGKPQIYGTQFKIVADAVEPFPIDDPAHLSERRAAMGLETYEENLARMREAYLPPKKAK
jgi:hypothetical protein